MAVCGGSGGGESEGEELLAEGPSCPPSTGLALLVEPGDGVLVPEGGSEARREPSVPRG